MTSKPSAIRSSVDLLKTTASNWMEDNALRLSAALAYYSIFSIAPLLILAVGLAGLFFGGDAAVSGHLTRELKGMIGDQAAQTVEAMIKSTSQPSKSITATIVGLLTMLIGASGVFGQLKDSVNTIWEVRPKPGLGIKGFIMERVLSFGMIVVIGFLLLISFMLTALLNGFSHWVEAIVKLPSWVWGGAGLLVSFAIVTLLFAMIFTVLPDVKIAWRNVWVGSLFTALFFELGKFALAYYLSRPSTASSFGSAGAVVLLLLWIYYASCILLFGAEFTKVYALAHGGKLEPTELATAVTSDARLQQGMAARDPSASPVQDRMPVPDRESLTSIFPAPPAEPPPPALPLSGAEEFLCKHAATSIFIALGVGLTAGAISRVKRTPVEGPTEQLRHGSKLVKTAAVVLAARFHKRILAKLREALGNVPLSKVIRSVTGR